MGEWVRTSVRLSPAQERNVVEFQNQVRAALGAPPEPVPDTPPPPRGNTNN